MSILDTILDYKRTVEVPTRAKTMPLADVRRLAEQTALPRDFAQALRHSVNHNGRVALIAEVKRASPSKGELVKGEFRPVEIAQQYARHGATAISVLTDEPYFKGSLDYLTQIKQAVDLIPILRKDFIVDAYQLYEARAAGADAALLIMAALDDACMHDLFQLTQMLQLTALVEVHDESETERALALGATVIGVNNRNLHNFVTDLQTTARCAHIVAATPDTNGQRILVSESGIFSPAHVTQIVSMGARAILVGESIITSGDIPAQIKALSNVSTQIF